MTESELLTIICTVIILTAVTIVLQELRAVWRSIYRFHRRHFHDDQ